MAVRPGACLHRDAIKHLVPEVGPGGVDGWNTGTPPFW